MQFFSWSVHALQRDKVNEAVTLDANDIKLE
jgi:hypothetical protein